MCTPWQVQYSTSSTSLIPWVFRITVVEITVLPFEMHSKIHLLHSNTACMCFMADCDTDSHFLKTSMSIERQTSSRFSLVSSRAFPPSIPRAFAFHTVSLTTFGLDHFIQWTALYTHTHTHTSCNFLFPCTAIPFVLSSVFIKAVFINALPCYNHVQTDKTRLPSLLCILQHWFVLYNSSNCSQTCSPLICHVISSSFFPRIYWFNTTI